MKRWFTLFAVMVVALGSGVLTGCTPEEEGAADAEAPAEDAAALSTGNEAATEGS
jgi:hypothetical protein